MDVDVKFPRPQEEASWWAKLTFSFCSPLLKDGYVRSLVENDVWKLGTEFLCDSHYTTTVRELWKVERLKPLEKQSFFKILMLAYRREFVLQVLQSVVWVALVLIGPAWFVPNILRYLQDPTWQTYIGWILIVFLFITQVLICFSAAHMLFRNSTLAVGVRSVCSRLIVDKVLTLTSTNKVAARIVNIMSNDLQRVFMMVMFTPICVGGVLGVLGVAVALVVQFDAAGAPPAAILMLSFPLNQLLSRRGSALAQVVLPLADARVKLMTHIVKAITVVKLFAWENLLAGRIEQVRANELKQRLKASTVTALLEAVALSTIAIATALFLLTWTLLGRPFLASDIFTAIALIVVGRIPLIQVQLFAQYFGEGIGSTRRVAEILELPSLPPSSTSSMHSLSGPAEVDAVDAVLRAGEEGEFELKQVTVKWSAGQTVCVVGAVGSGKTTLLLGVVRALAPVSGSLKVVGDCAFVPQEQFIVNDTLRNNILFGAAFDEERYRKVLNWCCLEPDLLRLVDGDRTEIGAFGVNLSGGQKARVALARAAYVASRQILVLDDPFSALDAHVGRQVHSRLVGGCVREGRLVVLSTHALHLAPLCDRVAVLKDGKMVEEGIFADVMGSESGVLRGLMQDYSAEQEKDKDIEAPESAKEMLPVKEDVTLQRKRPLLTNSQNDRSESSAAKSTLLSPRVLVQKEEAQDGSVKLAVYVRWLRGFDVGSLGVLLLALVAFGTLGFLDYFISFWVGNTLSVATTTYLWIYCVLCVFALGCYLWYLTSFWIFALRGAAKVHDSALLRLLKGKINWFESVPSGRIINRFSKDVDVVDHALPEAFKVFFGNLIQLIMFVIVVSVAYPYFLIVMVPVGLAFFRLTMYFNRTNRQIRRLEGLLRSPVFSDVSTLLSGLQTLRVYNQTDDFAARLLFRVDRFSGSVYMFWALSRWLSIRLDFLCACLVFASSIFSVAFKGTLPASFSAIAITYTLRMGSFLQWTFRNLSLMEASAVAAERLFEYSTDIPVETQGGWTDIPSDWPAQGRIEVLDASLRYAPELPLSLRSLSINVTPGQRVGIVGRTGAGKSTFASALFRLRELDSGVIRIDGLDISKIELRVLRSRLSIITQEPVLFQGTLRFNLDPFEEHTNERLWEVLQRVGLSELANANGGLEWPIQDGGQNLSAGERQVVCLARVLLRPSRVIVLDEATSNVDAHFDSLIQSVIRSDFKNSTILCIAHRLNTIIDSDRILVLDKGESVEYDHPGTLVREPTAFRDLLLDTGGETSRHLIKAATLAQLHSKGDAPEDVELYEMSRDFDVFKVDL